MSRGSLALCDGRACRGDGDSGMHEMGSSRYFGWVLGPISLSILSAVVAAPVWE